MEYITLNTGAKMPLEGFGVFQIPDAAECEQVVYDAIKTGYRLLDTAASYGNEEALGKVVKRAIADGLVTREELFITTKVWITDMKTEDSAYEAVKTSLQKLDMPYVDLVLLHQAMGDYFAAYRGITKAYKEGLTKAIGVSNFYPFVLVNLCANVEVIPAVNQVELHPFFQQEDALAVMKEYGIAPQAWGPLAEGKHGIFKRHRSSSAGIPSAAFRSFPSPSMWSVWSRTWISGISPLRMKRWSRSRKRTLVTARSSTISIPSLSSGCLATKPDDRTWRIRSRIWQKNW